VTSAGGTAQTLTYTYLGPPTVTGLNPTSGPESGDNVVTISGTGLADASAVTFTPIAPGTGGGRASFDVIDDNTIAALAPPGTGTAQVTVTTPAGTSTPTAAAQYTYVPGPGV
jgi:hypothetical protein